MSMYTRYMRGPDGIYRRQEEADVIPPQKPDPEKHTLPPVQEQQPSHASTQAPQKEPGLLNALLSRQFDADDLLLAAIVLLLLIDGGEEDWLAMLAALAFLFF